MQPSYQYQAVVLSLHDGDTITVQVDCGFRISYKTPVRFYGINAPELSTEAGKKALGYLQSLLSVGDNIVIKTFKNPTDKYGRWLAEIDYKGVSINQAMIDSGNAVAYFG